MTIEVVSLTVRALRIYLFDNDFDCKINSVNYNNAEARRCLYDLENQDANISYIVTGICSITIFI